MPRRPNDGYDADASETLHDDGAYVEPDVRSSIKKYLKAMGLTSKKQVKVSELRQAIREAIAEKMGQVPLKCPDCGSRNVGLWSISGDVKNPDWVECKKCGASGRIARYEIVETRVPVTVNKSANVEDLVCPKCMHNDIETWAEDGESADADWAECLKCKYTGPPEEFMLGEQASTMGRMSMMSTADEDPKEEILPEFADWAQGFQDSYDNKRYEQLARQVFDAWPHHGPDVDWAKVVDIYVKNRAKNVHTELDKDKLYEKVLNLAEDHYDGNTPPTVRVSQHQYGGSGSGSP